MGCMYVAKLDGVGPVDNRPSTDKLHHFVRKKKLKKKKYVTCYMWHVTRDMWHVTRDTWQRTRDMWHVGGGVNILSKFELPSSYCFWFIIYYEDLEEMADSLSDLINDEAFYRTAPVTPGLLLTVLISVTITTKIIFFCFLKLTYIFV